MIFDYHLCWPQSFHRFRKNLTNAIKLTPPLRPRILRLLYPPHDIRSPNITATPPPLPANPPPRPHPPTPISGPTTGQLQQLHHTILSPAAGIRTSGPSAHPRISERPPLLSQICAPSLHGGHGRRMRSPPPSRTRACTHANTSAYPRTNPPSSLFIPNPLPRHRRPNPLNPRDPFPPSFLSRLL